jgi:hypothetical protein
MFSPGMPAQAPSGPAKNPPAKAGVAGRDARDVRVEPLQQGVGRGVAGLPEVPLAEHARSVAGALQRLGSRTSDAGTFCTQSLGVRTSVPDAVVDPPMKSEIPCRATDLPVISDALEGEQTGRRRVRVEEGHALRREPEHVGRLVHPAARRVGDRVDLPVRDAHVVDEEDDDVGLGGRCLGEHRSGENGERDQARRRKTAGSHPPLIGLGTHGRYPFNPDPFRSMLVGSRPRPRSAAAAGDEQPGPGEQGRTGGGRHVVVVGDRGDRELGAGLVHIGDLEGERRAGARRRVREIEEPVVVAERDVERQREAERAAQAS